MKELEYNKNIIKDLGLTEMQVLEYCVKMVQLTE